MAEIDVQINQQDNQYLCTVTVTEGRGQTQHTVTVDEEDYQHLTAGQVPPESLRTFNLMVIQRYFPAYERTIRSRL